jgi:glycine oxidase
MAAKVIVVGAGIIGSSIAWRLAGQGFEVVLADAGRLGGEASWAAAGMLTVGAEFSAEDPVAAMALESLALYPKFVSELEAASGLSIEYSQCGGIQLAKSDAEWEELRRQGASQREYGIPSREMSAAELSEKVPCAATGGLFFSNDAVVAPRDVVRALRAACLRSGVELLENCGVREIRSTGDGVEVSFESESLRGGAAVLSAGAWSSSLGVVAPDAVEPRRSYPVRGHLVTFRAAPGTLPMILRHGATYVLQRADGQIVAGSTEEDCGFDREPSLELVRDIHRRAAELMPALAHMEPEDYWIGFRPAIDGHGPEIRRMAQTQIWVSFGHYRNGILLAPFTSCLVAGAIEVVAG